MSRFIRPLFWFLVVLTFFSLLSHFLIPIINYGQIGKETFVAEMIRSFINGETVGFLFPIRHFLEPHHTDLIPWAEEFPIFHLIIAGIHKLLALISIDANPIILSKTLNIGAFATLIAGFFSIGKTLFPKGDSNTPWIFAVSAVLFPAFQLYSIEVMPDLWMLALCVWAIQKTLAGKHFNAAVLIGLAALFKYYAAFTAFGIGLYHLYRWIKTKSSKEFLNAFTIALSIIPCVAFIIYFIKAGIPNPITEYRASDGHGHLSSTHGILEIKKWGRVGLWLFVKNSTIFGSLLAGFGLYQIRKSIHPLFITLMIGWFLFPLTFIESFIVHDYYGLQASIGTTIFMAIGLIELSKKGKIFFPSAIAVLTVWGIFSVQGMTKPITDFDRIVEGYPKLLEKFTSPPKRAFVISGISKPVIPHLLKLDSWIASYAEADQETINKIMINATVEMVMIHGFTSQDPETDQIKLKLESTGLLEVAEDRQYETTRLIVLKRKS